MSRLLLAALLLARPPAPRAGAVCSEDLHGVMRGTPHQLPEHYLMPRVLDWAIAVPSVCVGDTLGVLARVCVWVSPPTVRVVDRTAALVRSAIGTPSYLTVNVTVYCAAGGGLPTSTALATLDSLPEAAQALLRATPLYRSAVRPFWTVM